MDFPSERTPHQSPWHTPCSAKSTSTQPELGRTTTRLTNCDRATRRPGRLALVCNASDTPLATLAEIQRMARNQLAVLILMHVQGTVLAELPHQLVVEWSHQSKAIVALVGGRGGIEISQSCDCTQQAPTHPQGAVRNEAVLRQPRSPSPRATAVPGTAAGGRQPPQSRRNSRACRLWATRVPIHQSWLREVCGPRHRSVTAAKTGGA